MMGKVEWVKCPVCKTEYIGDGIDGICLGCIEKELTYLRGIEAAVILCNHGNRQSSAEHWRMLARVTKRHGLGWGGNMLAIANVLEMKP